MKSPDAFPSKKQQTEEASPELPLDEIRKIYDEHLNLVDAQLELISDSLHDLTSKIESEKPDTLVFLDISARIFGVPFKKYLDEKMGNQAPEVRFYNDFDLKRKYMEKKDMEDIFEKDFDPYKNQKVFVIDETYSIGKGLAALREAKKKLDMDIHYFALSYDPEGLDDEVRDENFKDTSLSREEHEQNLEDLDSDPYVTIYPNPIHNMFSRYTTRLYIDKSLGVLLTNNSAVEKSKLPKKRNAIPDASGYETPEQKAYEIEINKLARELVEVVKEKIYNKLSSKI